MSLFKGIWRWGRDRKLGQNRRASYRLECLEGRTLLATVTEWSPASSSVGVGIAAKVQATFDAAVQPNTISFTLTGPNNTTIPVDRHGRADRRHDRHPGEPPPADTGPEAEEVAEPDAIRPARPDGGGCGR